MVKGWVLHEIGKIKYEDVDMPKPQENEVLIKVRAAGICGSDIPRIYETGAHKMPLIPGHEFSGEVCAVGSDVSKDLIGKRASVYPRIPCGKCKECLNNMPTLCRSYDYVGSRRDGAFGEYVTAPAKNLLFLPDSVSFEEAAMLEPFAVAANAVRRGVASLNGEDLTTKTVAVGGLGTIGRMVIMLLKEAGFKRILAIGNKDTQKANILKLGILEEDFCNARNEDVSNWVKNASDGGVSIFFECVGKNECISEGILSVAPAGTLILVGNPYSDMKFDKDTYWKILRDQMNIVGIWNSRFEQTVDPLKEPDDWNFVLDKISKKTLKPEILITHRLRISELEKGFLIMRDKTEDYCKIMMVNE